MIYFNMERKNFEWLNEDSIEFLTRGYLQKNVTPTQRIKQIADTAEKLSGLEGFSDKFYNYMSKGWISLSSPVWANYGLKRGLPISCFGQFLVDDTADILRAGAESGIMSKMGGGTSGYFGELRPRGTEISAGGKSNGSVSFMEIFETLTNIISQNGIRRGNMAVYLPTNHGDIEEFLRIRDNDHSIQNLSIGTTISNNWMQSMIEGDIEKRNIWAKILKKRSETGYPYLFFEDTVNNNAPQAYKDKGKKIYASNLCSEIALSTDEKESFVCCLSSVNLLYYDEWKDTDLIEVMCVFLDTVLTEFIEKAKGVEFMEKTVSFASNQRAIGIGVLGLHSYLQSKMIPFEGLEVKMLLNNIFKNIDNQSLEASKKYAKLWGEPELLKGYGERWVTRHAIAPTTSSSFILGQISPSIEPLNSNYFIKDLAKGKFSYRNPLLEKLLDTKGKNTTDVWKSIMSKGGSVQHLSFLSEREKSVFKTFAEISQMEIIQNASIIQKYIDQAISLNIMIPPDVPARDINKLHIEAWKLGLKTLYYQRGQNLAQNTGRDILECSACES